MYFTMGSLVATYFICMLLSVRSYLVLFVEILVVYEWTHDFLFGVTGCLHLSPVRTNAYTNVL